MSKNKKMWYGQGYEESFNDKILPIYKRTVNSIEDFFEYRYQTNSPQEIKIYVMDCIKALASDIEKVSKEK